VAWFRVDDRLPKNRKARAVRKSHKAKRRDVAPFGLWAIAGALSDDGFIPFEVLEEWDDDAQELADRLVAAGLWHATKRDGEPGYIFHDWHDQNPARDDNDPSSTGTFGNHVRWHVQKKVVNPDCIHCPTEPDEMDDPSADIGATIAPTRGDIGGESLPSRPDPTRPDPSPTTISSPTDVGGPTPIDRFGEFWDTYDHKVGKKAAEQKWRLALKKPGVTADRLIAAAAAYVTYERVHNHAGRYIKHPSTWLNGEHWNDERTVTAPVTRVGQHLALARELAEAEQPLPQIGQRR
jgi:hypothetical protein